MNRNDPIAPTTHPGGPHGLGGMLWIPGVALMLLGSLMSSLLPLTLWSLSPAQFAAARAAAIEAGISAESFQRLIVKEWLAAVIWLFGIVVAEAFFRRSPRFRWIATSWLAALAALQWGVGHRWMPAFAAWTGNSELIGDAIGAIVLLLPVAYLWLSRRVRNTFSPFAQPRREGPPRPFLDAPRSWGGGVWCVAGAIILLVHAHAVLAMAHWPYLFPPELTPEIAARLNAPVDPRGHGNAASALITFSYTSKLGQAPYARMFLALHVLGLLLALWSIRLFVRRASRLRWILAVSALCLVSAHGLYWLMQNDIPMFCVYCGHYDAPRDHLAKSLSLFVAVTTILLLPAVRRRFRKTGNTPRM